MFAMRTLPEELVAAHVMQGEVECDYSLLGITGVEDVLQDNV